MDNRLHYVSVALLSIFSGNLEGTWRPDQCPLFEVEKCLFLGGPKCISAMVKLIGGG